VLTNRDVLYINMFAMGTSLINDNFLWVLILIPLYGQPSKACQQLVKQPVKHMRI
jgi:hypothetical protein